MARKQKRNNKILSISRKPSKKNLSLFVIIMAVIGGVWFLYRARADHCIPSPSNYCVAEGDNINRTYCEGEYYTNASKPLPKPAPVTNLRPTDIEQNFVVLEWDYISQVADQLDAYFEVYRNGTRIAIFAEEHQIDNKEKYEDFAVSGSSNYIYQVRALHSCLDKNGNAKNRYGDFTGTSADTPSTNPSNIDVEKTIETLL